MLNGVLFQIHYQDRDRVGRHSVFEFGSGYREGRGHRHYVFGVINRICIQRFGTRKDDPFCHGLNATYSSQINISSPRLTVHVNNLEEDLIGLAVHDALIDPFLRSKVGRKIIDVVSDFADNLVGDGHDVGKGVNGELLGDWNSADLLQDHVF